MPPEAPTLEAPAAPIAEVSLPAGTGVAPTAAPGTKTAGAYDAIDSLFEQTSDGNEKVVEHKAAPVAKLPGKQPAVKAAEKTPAEVTPKAEEKPPVKAEEPPKPPKAASLREALDLEKGKVTTLTAKVKELEGKLSKPAEDPEKKKLMEERDNWGKTRQQLEDELKFAKYERSSEYKEKYEKPFVDAYTAAQKRTESIKVKEPDKINPDTQETIPGATRQATAHDFDELMGIVDDNSAWEFAQKTFGDKAQIVWSQREKVMELNNARTRALDEYRTKGAEREKVQSELSKKQEEEFKGLFDSEVKSARENPTLKHWFTPDEGDAKAKEILDRGFKMAEDAFGDTSQMSKDARARLYGAVLNRSAAAGLLAHKLKGAEARITELQSKLEEYEKSEPNHDGDGGGKTVPKDKGGKVTSVDAMIDRLAQQ